MQDETKNSAEFLVTVSCTIKQFSAVVKESLELFSLKAKQILQYGALNPIKDSVSKTLASKVGKSSRTEKQSIGRMFSVLLS